MREFLASDVLFARARDEINPVLADQGISRGDPRERLPPRAGRTVARPPAADHDPEHLRRIRAAAANGVHGLALLSTSIDDTQLTADADNTVSLGKDAPVVKVEVQNQGDQEEKEVTVSYSLSGGAVPLEGEGTIARLDASGIDDATLPLDDLPETDVPLTLEVEVLPVPGEEVADNNAATYTVTFN